MPLFFLVIGLLLIITAIRGTTGDFASRFASDVSGGYLKWLAAILVIGGLGYFEPIKEPSRYLLALIALVVLLTNGSGFISQLANQIQNPGQATTAAPAGGNPNLPAIPVQTQSSGGGSSSGGGASTLTSLIPVATTVASFL